MQRGLVPLLVRQQERAEGADLVDQRGELIQHALRAAVDHHPLEALLHGDGLVGDQFIRLEDLQELVGGEVVAQVGVVPADAAVIVGQIVAASWSVSVTRMVRARLHSLRSGRRRAASAPAQY